MATVNLTVEVPDDEVEGFRRALVELCFDYGLPVDDEDEFEEDTDPDIDLRDHFGDAMAYTLGGEPGIIDLDPDPEAEEAKRDLQNFIDRLHIVVIL